MQVVITFSLSVLISFLSSLFFNFPGASAMGREVWKMKSLPAHSAACRKVSAKKCKLETFIKIVRETVIQEQAFKHPHHFFMSGRHFIRHTGSVITWLLQWFPTRGAQLTAQLQKSKFQFYWTCATSMAGRKGLAPRRHRAVSRTQLQKVLCKCVRLLSSLICSY